MPPRMRPLDGVRVIDLATFIAAPLSATILGEFGAEVIKIEHPAGGDPMRRFGTASEDPDRSLAWLSEARNKHSATLDLRAAAGAAALRELVRRADVLCENFRPGTLEGWGLGPDVLHALNPALVILRITGYGQTGPYRDRPGFARIAHAVGGLTHLAGMPDGPPVTPGSTSLADYIGGFQGAIGVMMALRVAEATGRGQVIDVALHEAIFRVLDDIAPAHDRYGIVRGREGVMTRQVCPHGHFACSDGKWVAIACTSDKMWQRMALNVLGQPDLAESHPRTADRLADRATIDGAVEAFTRRHPAAQVVELCTAGGVPCGPINTIADIFADPHFAARRTIERIADPALGEIAVPAVLPRLSATPGGIESLGPPLGDWNARLAELIADEAEIRPAARAAGQG
ncbi:MAG TPA: CoA transferase [Thermohalobaculum sp.]|nr:CoA transferase [Thermohalobaculum sp.]